MGIGLAFVLAIQGRWKGTENFDFSVEGAPSIRKRAIISFGSYSR